MRLVDHVFDDQLVEKLTIKIILPEGAKSVENPLLRAYDNMFFFCHVGIFHFGRRLRSRSDLVS